MSWGVVWVFFDVLCVVYPDVARVFHTNPVVQYVHGKIDSIGLSIDARVDKLMGSLMSIV